mgnify:CR=1 FL=1
MGNYYEGRLSIALRKDIPHQLMIDLISLCFWNYEKRNDEELKSHWKEEPLFKRKDISNISISYSFLLEDEENGRYLLEYEGENLCDEMYDEIWDKHIGYCVDINICTKRNFFENDSDLGQDFIDWLKPYAIEKFNYIGQIKDEDGTFEKEYFLDSLPFLEEKKQREFLCKGCEKDKPMALCKNYVYCKRAYEVAINRKE